ncbi:hypothetical protein [Methanolobus halotolerans]|nr:hypothetical protein [Methanolobus halotolerans]
MIDTAKAHHVDYPFPFNGMLTVIFSGPLRVESMMYLIVVGS